MGNLCSCAAPPEEPKRQVVKPVPKPPFIQEFTFAPKTGSKGLKVFPTAAFFKPGGLSSSSALRVVEQSYVFAAMFDGLCGNESALACKAQCYEAFAAALQQQKQQRGEEPMDYVSAVMKMFNSLDEQLIKAAAKKPYMAGMGAVGIVSVLDLQTHKVVMASVGSCHGTVGHAVGSFNQSTAEAINMVQAMMHNRPYFSSLSVLAPDLPKTQAEYALLHTVRDHVLGFGIVKDPSLASAYRSSAQGRENAERGIPGSAYPTPPAPPTQKQGTKGGAKAAAQPVVPPGRAGWPFEEVPVPEVFHGCEVQINERDLTMYDEHIILLSPCALSLISPSDAVGLAHAYDTPHMQLMRAAVDHVPEPVKPAPQSGECVQGGGGGGGEEGGGGKLREGAGSTDGGGQREEQEPGVRRQPQQLQQPLMLSHGLGGPQARAESTGGQEALLGPAESKGIFNVASLLVHFMTSSSRMPSKWGEKACRVHNTLDEDEVLPEAQAVALPAPPSSPSSLPSRSASAAPGVSSMSSAALRGNSTDAAAKLPRDAHEKDSAFLALSPPNLNPSDHSKATPFATDPVQRGSANAHTPSPGDNAHAQAGSADAHVWSNSNGAHAHAGSDVTHVHAHAEAHVRTHRRPLPLQTASSIASATSSPKITLPTTPNSPSGHNPVNPSLELANQENAMKTLKLGAASPKRKGPPAPRIKAQQRDAAVVVLALEWPVSLTSHQANRMRVVEASRVTNPRALYRWHMVRQLVRFMGRKRVALRTCWHQTVHAAVLEAAQACRDAEVLAWKELGMAVQLTRNNKVMLNDTSITSQQRPSNAMSALDRSSVMSSSSSLSVPQGSAISASSEMRRSRTSKVQTMACQRPHHEPPVLLSDKWNSPSVTHQHALPRVNTRPGSSTTGGRAHAAPTNQYAHLSASQRPGGNAAEQAKSLASAHKPPSSAIAKSSAARAVGRQQGVGSSGDSASVNRGPSKGFERSEGDSSGHASARRTPRQIGAAYDLRRRSRPASSSEVHVDMEHLRPSSPPAPSGASSPTASVSQSQSSNNSGRMAHSNASSRYLQSSASSKPAQSTASSGRGAQASSASSRGLQSPGSKNLRSSATSKPPAPPPRNLPPPGATRAPPAKATKGRSSQASASSKMK